MAQFDLPVIDPASDGGADLAGYLNDWRDAVLSGHSGASRPSYAIVGMVWNTGGATPVFSYFDGSNDQQLFTRLATGGLSVPTEFQVPGVLIAKDGTFTYKGNAIFHAGNDGTGSGLDADLLDGSHLSEIARLAIPNTFSGVITHTARVDFQSTPRIDNGTHPYFQLKEGATGDIKTFRWNATAGRLEITDTTAATLTKVVTQETLGDDVAEHLETSSYQLIEAVTVSAAATTDIALPTGYAAFDLIIDGMTCSTDGYQPLARMVEDDDTLLSGASDYAYHNIFAIGGAGGNVSNGDSRIEMNPNTAALGNDTDEVLHASLRILNPRSATVQTAILGQVHAALATAGTFHGGAVHARRRAATAEKAIRIFADSGNLSFNYALYGIAS